jgi:squalene-associated FAD-dependent desaturase
MSIATIHIIGAGLAGLSAAVELADAGVKVCLHESAKHAGGRCRSYFDHKLQLQIDNGNHLVLSGNKQVLRYLKTINAGDSVTHLADAHFPFVDLTRKTRWSIAPSAGRLPFWLLSPNRRVPDARMSEYVNLLRLLWCTGDQPISQLMDCEGPLYENLIRPFLLAAMNTQPAEASGELAGKLMLNTLMKGAQACKPIIAHQGLSHSFIDPAIAYIRKSGTFVRFATLLRDITFSETQATNLRFEDHTIPLAPQDIVILALPPQMTAALVPGLTTPDAFNAIMNIHYAIAPKKSAPPIIGILGARSEWLFAYPERLSVTISAAQNLQIAAPEDLAAEIWKEVAEVTGIDAPLPPWRILLEKRATFAATPEQNKQRPGSDTAYINVFLAGDWTATGLPATMEGAIKSGVTAARKANALSREWN